MPDPIFTPAAGLQLARLTERLVSGLFPNQNAEDIARFSVVRQSPAGRQRELGRRDVTRSQLVAGIPMINVSGGRPGAERLPSPVTPPPGTTPGALPTFPGGVPLGVPPLPLGVPPGLMGQVGSSTRGARTASTIPRLESLGRVSIEDYIRRIGNARVRAVARRVARGFARTLPAAVIVEVLRGVISRMGVLEPSAADVREMEAEMRQQLEILSGNIEVTAERLEMPSPDTLQGDIVIHERQRGGGLPPPRWEQLPAGAQRPGQRRESMPVIRAIGRRIAGNLQNIVLGTIGLGTLSLLRRRSSSSVSPLTVNVPAIATPTATPIPQPLTVVQGGGVPFTGTGTQQCECKEKKKREKRKCLERAQVVWKTGRYKGKLAGTRCVRFAKGK